MLRKIVCEVTTMQRSHNQSRVRVTGRKQTLFREHQELSDYALRRDKWITGTHWASLKYIHGVFVDREIFLRWFFSLIPRVSIRVEEHHVPFFGFGICRSECAPLCGRHPLAFRRIQEKLLPELTIS